LREIQSFLSSEPIRAVALERLGQAQQREKQLEQESSARSVGD
jgi:hypothetical protein